MSASDKARPKRDRGRPARRGRRPRPRRDRPGRPHARGGRRGAREDQSSAPRGPRAHPGRRNEPTPIDGPTFAAVMGAQPVDWQRLHEVRQLCVGLQRPSRRGAVRLEDRELAAAGQDLVGVAALRGRQRAASAGGGQSAAGSTRRCGAARVQASAAGCCRRRSAANCGCSTRRPSRPATARLRAGPCGCSTGFRGMQQREGESTRSTRKRLQDSSTPARCDPWTTELLSPRSAPSVTAR